MTRKHESTKTTVQSNQGKDQKSQDLQNKRTQKTS